MRTGAESLTAALNRDHDGGILDDVEGFLDTDGDGDLDLGDLGNLARKSGLLGKLFGG
ncbi:MAG: hypothetical protein ABFS42_12920 [Candidatus Krumholzibacteriota bacterium]